MTKKRCHEEAQALSFTPAGQIFAGVDTLITGSLAGKGKNQTFAHTEGAAAIIGAAPFFSLFYKIVYCRLTGVQQMRTFRFTLLGITLIILGIWLGREFTHRFTINEADEFPGATVLQVPVPIFQISLTDHNGENFGVRRLAGKWTFMFFGYTHCPDVCPMALVDLNAVFQNLDEKGDRIFKKYNIDTQFVFVSVDPQRDTVEELKEYVPYFNKNFIGLTADQAMIEKLARPLGVSYMPVPGKDPEGDYYVDHSASFLLIDPLGRLRASFPPPHDPDQIAEDFRRIRNKYTEECCRTDITSENNKREDE